MDFQFYISFYWSIYTSKFGNGSRSNIFSLSIEISNFYILRKFKMIVNKFNSGVLRIVKNIKF